MYMYPYMFVDWRGEVVDTTAFKNFSTFLIHLQQAIHDEASAIEFYRQLLEMAPDELHKLFIQHAFQDEQKHQRMLSRLYTRLTGRTPMVSAKPESFENYRNGLLLALTQELEAAETYRDMFLSTRDPNIRDVLFETMTDEQEHAMRFSFLYHLPEH
jgi:rubrerythrin